MPCQPVLVKAALTKIHVNLHARRDGKNVRVRQISARGHIGGAICAGHVKTWRMQGATCRWQAFQGCEPSGYFLYGWRLRWSASPHAAEWAPSRRLRCHVSGVRQLLQKLGALVLTHILAIMARICWPVACGCSSRNRLLYGPAGRRAAAMHTLPSPAAIAGGIG